MPFPLAHPAAVLPLMPGPLVASALVAGAVAPDLLYVGAAYQFATVYIDGNLTITRTHEFSSAFWLDPLLALLILLGFQLLMKRPLLALAPAALAGRLPPPAVRARIPSPVQVLWIVVSTVIGAFTHVLWDSFTHYDVYFVRHNWKFFTADIIPFWDVNRVLQYLSSVGGVLVIAVWLHFWWRKTSPSPIDATSYAPRLARYAVLVAVVLLAATAAVVEVGRAEGPLLGEAIARLVLSGAASGVLLALTGYVLIWHALRLRRLQREWVAGL